MISLKESILSSTNSGKSSNPLLFTKDEYKTYKTTSKDMEKLKKDLIDFYGLDPKYFDVYHGDSLDEIERQFKKCKIDVIFKKDLKQLLQKAESKGFIRFRRRFIDIPTLYETDYPFLIRVYFDNPYKKYDELRIWYWGDISNLFNQVQEWSYIEEL
jgi:hypothetical protein